MTRHPDTPVPPEQSFACTLWKAHRNAIDGMGDGSVTWWTLQPIERSWWKQTADLLTEIGIGNVAAEQDRADRAEATLAKVAEACDKAEHRARWAPGGPATHAGLTIKRLRKIMGDVDPTPEPQADSKPGQNLEVPVESVPEKWFTPGGMAVCPTCNRWGGQRWECSDPFHNPAPEAPTEATQTGGEVR